MKRHEILGIAFVVLVVAVFGTLTIKSLPKRLDPPTRFSREATATGIVSKVTTKGIEVRFADGKKWFFRETGFTNGQSVRVEVRVHYAKYYDVPSPPVAELIFRSVFPNP